MPVYEAQLIPSGAAILRKTGAVPIADCRDDAGGPLNADLVAPAAKQMGAYVGQRIATLVAEGNLPGPFTHHHQGDLATLGRKSAIVSIGRIKLTGFVSRLHTRSTCGLR